MLIRLQSTTRGRRRAFSLIEVVLVIVIVGVVAAIAVPRFSRAVEKTRIAAMMHDTRVLNKAIDYYRAEHEDAPPTLDDIVAQLTQYTDVTGTTRSASMDPGQGAIYGPYVKQIPPLSFGPHEGDVAIAAADGAGAGEPVTFLDSQQWLHTGDLGSADSGRLRRVTHL